MTETAPVPPTLRRVLGLPLLVFYGVGVTVGAGIFALIGEITRVAGDHAPLAFLLAGLIAGATGISYALLAAVYPRAAGEAVFVKIGLGAVPGRLVGLTIAATALASSAVIALAFAGYLAAVAPVPVPVATVGIVALLALVAWAGVRESVALAAIVTVLEVATLVVVAIAGAPLLADAEILARVLTPPADPAALSAVAAAALIAFFAFIGFEDIENMAEETVDPRYVMPRAILLTLAITVAIYAALALIAVALPDREGLTASAAPLAFLFEQVSGRSGAPIAAMASIAMVNGILVQIVMASRVLYGMAREGLVPAGLGVLDPRRRTPARAIALVAVLIAGLALFLPIVNLAQAASALVLCVFTTVNVSLWRIGGRVDADPSLRLWRWWGMLGAILSVGLLLAEGARLAGLDGPGGTIVH